MGEQMKPNNYESFKIPNRILTQKHRADSVCPDLQDSGNASASASDSVNQISLSDGFFYEVDIDSTPSKTMDEPFLLPQKILPPEKDEIRDLFYQMRNISKNYNSPSIAQTRFFDRRVQQDNAIIFYRQAVFMKDFEDDYPEQVQFSAYYPYYQMLGYEQLRTYFTWRTQIRKGIVRKISLSYVFLYIYELLSNIGVDNPQAGLEQMIFFWKSFRVFDSSIDRYVIRWLKDYHIYYQLPQPFKDFAAEHELTEHYPKMVNPDDDFDLFCNISKYDIRKSAFFSEERSDLITNCFSFVLDRIKQDFEIAKIPFDNVFFRPAKKIISWEPFRGALFYPWFKSPDARIVISENEIYSCLKNEWKFSTVITTEKGKQFIGYVMKQMESILRKITNYKFKLSAKIEMVNPQTQRVLLNSGLNIEKIVQTAVLNFYRESTRTVVTVDHSSLARIREEALVSQNALIVEEQADPVSLMNQGVIPSRLNTVPLSAATPPNTPLLRNDTLFSAISERDTPRSLLQGGSFNSNREDRTHISNMSADPAVNNTMELEQSIFEDTEVVSDSDLGQDSHSFPCREDLHGEILPDDSVSDSVSNQWESLKNILSEFEDQALAIILRGDSIKHFADESGIMLEVLIDGINEKAMDCIGDHILDDDFLVFEEYIKDVRRVFV